MRNQVSLVEKESIMKISKIRALIISKLVAARTPVVAYTDGMDLAAGQPIVSIDAMADEIVAALRGKKGKNSKKSATERSTVFGHSAVSVIRWMAKRGWDFETAAAAIRAAGCNVSDITIRCQLAVDENGVPVRGTPAKLSKEQAAMLKEMAS